MTCRKNQRRVFAQMEPLWTWSMTNHVMIKPEEKTRSFNRPSPYKLAAVITDISCYVWLRCSLDLRYLIHLFPFTSCNEAHTLYTLSFTSKRQCVLVLIQGLTYHCYQSPILANFKSWQLRRFMEEDTADWVLIHLQLLHLVWRSWRVEASCN